MKPQEDRGAFVTSNLGLGEGLGSEDGRLGRRTTDGSFKIRATGMTPLEKCPSPGMAKIVLFD